MWWPAPRYRLAALAFIVSTAHWPAIFSAPWAPRWWALAIGLPLLCDLRPRSGDGRIAFLAIGAGVWALAAGLMAAYPQGALLPTYFFMLLLLAGVAGAAVEDFGPVMAGFVAGAAVSSVGQALQHFGLAPGGGGLFYNTEVMAEFMAPLAAWAFVARRWALGLILAVPVVYVQSRVGMAACIVGLLWAGTIGRPWLRLASICLALAVAVAGLGMFGMGKLDGAAQRVILWATALWSLTPMGHGLGWWAQAHPFPYESFAHSDLLQFGVELGLGALLLVAIPILILRRGVADPAKGACLVALCFEAVVSFPLQMPATGFLAAALAGHLACAGLRVRSAERAGGISRGHAHGRPLSYDPGMARGR